MVQRLYFRASHIERCEIPSSGQILICGLQLQINNSGHTLPFFLFYRNIFGIYLSMLSLILV